MSEVKRIDFFAYLDDDVAELDHHEAEDGSCVWYADYAALEAECERMRDMLREASVAMGEAHDSLFVQCLSNGITNAWGKPVNVSKINDLQLTAKRIDAALSAKP